MTYEQAISALPAEARWSCSFGLPGKGGYQEYFRTPEGERFVIENGTYSETAPFVWAAKKLCGAVWTRISEVGRA